MRTSFPTLASILAENGFATGAVINVSVLNPSFGVDRGFQHYDVSPPGVKRTADKVTEDALAWIDLNRDRPFLMFVHYFDPHLSYAPPAPYDTAFDPDYSGRIGRSFEQEDLERLSPVLFGRQDPETRADWNHIRALYDGEIAFTDDAIGDLLEGLEARGLKDKTLVVLLSDHGEEFFEHGGFGHGHTLYREVIQVPFIVSLPGEFPEGARVTRQVRLVDVMPTIVDVLGIEVKSHVEGVSLVPLIEGTFGLGQAPGSQFPPDVAYSEGNIRGPEVRGISRFPWKLIYTVSSDERFVFDLRSDPGEVKDLRPEGLEAAESLESMLFHSMYALSDTWYVEMVGDGQAHIFDLRILARKGVGIGRIHTPRLLDDRGHFAEEPGLVETDASGSVIEIRDLELRGSLVLAFRTDMAQGLPLTFDFRIDGEPAHQQTYVGRAFRQPGQMPFSSKSRRASASSAVSSDERPPPPYLWVRFSGASYRGETPAEMDDRTRKDLRALGYIQ
jgi:hypothetical protein